MGDICNSVKNKKSFSENHILRLKQVTEKLHLQVLFLPPQVDSVSIFFFF